MDQRCAAGDDNILEDGYDGEKEVETRDTAVLHGVVVDGQAVLVVLLDRDMSKVNNLQGQNHTKWLFNGNSLSLS